MRPLNIIVCCAENRAIGRDGRLPWSIPEDRAFFESKTAGQIVVLGRLCFTSWPEATADGRRAVVVASEGLPAAALRPGSQEAHSLPEALARAETLPGDIYICGGQRIYEEAVALPRPIRLYLTLVHAQVPGDRFFPEWRGLGWRETERREAADRNWRYTFLTLEKGSGPLQ